MKYTINLLPKPEETIVDKVVYFSFHYLRYILVITQFVVICVFFYRFRVDQEIVDLKDGLTQKKEIINATTQLLNEVRIIDTKLNVAASILNEQDTLSGLFSYFITTLPSDFQINKITMRDDSISFEGYTQNVESIKQFEENVKAEGRFQEVKPESVERTRDGFTFTYSLNNYQVTR